MCNYLSISLIQSQMRPSNAGSTEKEMTKGREQRLRRDACVVLKLQEE